MMINSEDASLLHCGVCGDHFLIPPPDRCLSPLVEPSLLTHQKPIFYYSIFTVYYIWCFLIQYLMGAFNSLHQKPNFYYNVLLIYFSIERRRMLIFFYNFIYLFINFSIFSYKHFIIFNLFIQLQFVFYIDYYIIFDSFQ